MTDDMSMSSVTAIAHCGRANKEHAHKTILRQTKSSLEGT